MGKRLSAAHKKAISDGLKKHHNKKSKKRRAVPSAAKLQAAAHKANDNFMRSIHSTDGYAAYVKRKRLLKKRANKV